MNHMNIYLKARMHTQEFKKKINNKKFRKRYLFL